MKKEKQFGMNYVHLGGWFNQHYLYVDLNVDGSYVADSLFYRRKVPVGFEEEMVRNGDQYRIIFCKIRNKYQKTFEEALAEIKNKMSLLEHNDYDEYCGRLMLELSGGKEIIWKVICRKEKVFLSGCWRGIFRIGYPEWHQTLMLNC